MTQTAPKGFRLHIGIFGRRNVGKSSLLNTITRQNVSIVSDIAGTTTDPVEKPMELLPLGPVLFIDTAGIDDTGLLGNMRIAATRRILDRCDLSIIVTDCVWGPFEHELLAEMTSRKIPLIVVFNKTDIVSPPSEIISELDKLKIPHVAVAALHATGISEFRQALINAAPADFIDNPAIIGDLVGAGETAVLVVPIDKEAPKGRLILPQVQSIRDLLDSDAITVVVKERELRAALENLRKPPRLVVTDSQAFLKVVADTPADLPLTSFSILFSRFKGDLTSQTEGALAIEHLKPGDSVLIAEACSHHPISDDIGRVKIPRWLTQYAGGKLEFTTMQGHDFPENLSGYKLVIHCGACMLNRRETLSRLNKCRESGIPVTNYGLAIAYSLGILERALSPFPAALEIYRRSKSCQ